MARSKAQADDEVARGADVPLALAQNPNSLPPRDALVDLRDTDYVPDIDDKGYHVGTVRQPAEPVLTRAGAVRFESNSGRESKFETAKEQKERSNAREAENPDLYGGVPHQPISVRASDISGVGGKERLQARGIVVEDDVKGDES